MMRIFLDTTALAWRYVPQSWRDQVLALIELGCGLKSLGRDGFVGEVQYAGTMTEIRRNFLDMEIVPLSDNVARMAVRACVPNG